MPVSKTPSFRFSSGKKDDCFVGAKISGGELTFTFPELLDVPPGKEKERAKELLAALSFAKRSSAKAKTYIEDRYSSEGSDAFLAMLFLIDDYRSHGRYENREKITVRGGRGKIDWKKTRKQAPVYLGGGHFAYPSYYRKVDTERNSLLVDIYRLTVGKSIEMLGWLFDIQADDYLAAVPTFISSSYPRLYRAVIEARNASFDDLKRRRLSSMGAVLLSIMEEGSTDAWSYGSENMEDVFENILRRALTGSPLFDGSYDPKYSFLPLSGPGRNISIRPDVVVRENRDIYVFDAKYYRYGVDFNPSLLPSSDSVLKQFAYAEHIDVTFHPNRLFNSFVLPIKLAKLTGNPVARLMKGQTVAYGGKIVSSSCKGKINVLLVDLTTLIKEWLCQPSKLKSDLLEGGRQ